MNVTLFWNLRKQKSYTHNGGGNTDKPLLINAN